jgi:hypothetical protein
MTGGCCPSCGQTLPRDYLFIGTDKSPLALQGTKLTIFNAVSKAGAHGIHAERLYNIVYAGVRDGGPGFKTLATHVHQLNKCLRVAGKMVACGRGGSRQYRLVDL